MLFIRMHKLAKVYCCVRTHRCNKSPIEGLQNVLVREKTVASGRGIAVRYSGGRYSGSVVVETTNFPL